MRTPLFLVPLLLFAACASAPPGPASSKAAPATLEVVPRAAWGAAPPDTSALPPMGRVRHVVVHHTYTTADGPADEPRHVASIQRMHDGPERDWGDIAYHFLIGPSGRVFEGRPTTYAPASGTVYLTDAQREAAGQDALGRSRATVPTDADGTPLATPPGASAGHLTISVIGDYTETLPPPEARAALVTLVAQQLRAHGLGVDDVRFHREVAVGTECPGQALYDWFRGPARRAGAQGRGLRRVAAALRALDA